MEKTRFLAISSQHVLITGAAGNIGSQAVREFLGRLVQCFYVQCEHFYQVERDKLLDVVNYAHVMKVLYM